MKLKKEVKIASLVILVLIVIGITLFLFTTKMTEKKMISQIEEMGIAYYHDLHAAMTKGMDAEQRKAEMKMFEELGIRVNLEGLINHNADNRKKIERFVFKGEECSITGTQVAIFPKDPFDKDDFEIKVVLDCPGLE